MSQKFPLYYWAMPFLFIIACFACNQTSTSTKPSAPPPKIENPSKEEDRILSELDKRTGVQTQTIWHSPRILIQQLGDLSDKTVANIGAGPYGYFSFQIAGEAKKVIAIDIDPVAIHFMDSMSLQLLPASLQGTLETRLVEPNDPKLMYEEADVVTIMNTYAYISDRINYLKNLKRGISTKGRLVIVDFKMRKLPLGPPQSEKVPLYQVERDLENAGYQIILVDDKSLEYQYMLMAVKK